MTRAAASLLALFLLTACTTTESLPPEPLRGDLPVSVQPALEMLAFLGQEGAELNPSDLLGETLAAIGFLVDLSAEEVEAALRASRGTAGEPSALTFRAAARAPAEALRSVRTLEEVLAARSDAIRSRVARLLPESTDSGPPLPLLLTLGLKEGQPIGLVPWRGGRALLLDALALAGSTGGPGVPLDQRALGRKLARRIAPELFHVRYEHSLERSGLTGPLTAGPERLLHALLNEGCAGFLALPEAERYDAQGRRTPVQDSRARGALRRFEQNLAELLDPETAPDRLESLIWSFSNGPRTERWGTYAGALMIDTIDRFARPGRMRAVLANGPLDLIAAYREICGRHSAIPPLDPRAQILLRTLAGSIGPDSAQGV
ncbi:MAG: DUF5700 domain-containing putative Zn-dependent protease [Planctomycetota bacterium]